MSLKSNASLTELTGGSLEFLRQFELTVSDSGTGGDNVNFSDYTFEDNRKTCNHVKIINDGGLNAVYVVFNSPGSTINTNDNRTYNVKVYPGSPFTEIELDGEARSAGFRCYTGLSTTVKLLAW